MEFQEFSLKLFLLLCCQKCFGAKGKLSNNEEFKITVVIDPGKDENYLSLKAKAEDLFENVSKIENDPSKVQQDQLLKITLEMVNAARVGDSMYSSQSIEDNPLKITRQKVCTEIMNGSVVVILMHPPEEKSLASATSYALGFYKVPVISVSSRDVEFSDKVTKSAVKKNVHSSFLRTVPPYSQQAEIWYKLLMKLDYYKAIFIYPDEPNAVELKTYFLKLSQNNIECHYIEYPLNLESAQPYVEKINASNINVILFYATVAHAEMFFKAADDFGILKTTRLWVVNEQALKATNAPVGLLGVKLNTTAEQLRWTALEDAYRTIFHGLRSLKSWSNQLNVNLTVPSICDEMENSQWMATKIGQKFYDALIKVNINFDGTGSGFSRSLIAYDEAGDRIGFRYSLVNVDNVDYFNNVEALEKIHMNYVGGYGVDQINSLMYGIESHIGFLMDENRTVWPDKKKEKPPNVTLKKHLQVVTVEDPPFVTKKELLDGQTCAVMDEQDSPWTYCSHTWNALKKHYCCSGLAIDLLLRLARNTSFTFDLHLVNDGLYGRRNKSFSVSIWNGAVGELHRREVDMAVAALTINEERDGDIDFSKPWLYHGITILEKKKPRLSPMESFMQPFTPYLWTALFSSVIAIGFVLFILDKYSPFSRFYQTKSITKNDEDEEQPLNFSGSMWFVWGVLLDSGIGERTPRSLSARVMGMVWCGFSMIMVASYTANLAAFLVLDQPLKSLTGITDTRLRNPTSSFKFATVESTNVYSYFKKHVEFQTMFRTMESENTRTSDEAVEKVKSGDLDAFIWDSTRLEYEVSRSCELITSGGIFGRSAYGIGLQKGSDWTSIISLAILHLHESGEMEDLESKWITGRDKIPCKADDDAPVRLGLMNMRDLFILVAGGIVFGFVFITIEIFYEKRKRKRLKQKQLGLHYGRLWRNRVREKLQRKDFEDHYPPDETTPMSQRRRRSLDSFEMKNGHGRKQLYSPIPVEYAVMNVENSPRNRGRWSSSASPPVTLDMTVNPNEPENGVRQQIFFPPPPSYNEYQAYVPRRSVIV